MSGTLYLAWRYLAHHRLKTAILVLALTLIFFIPSGLQVLVDQSEARMTARALSTPLLVGTKGSPLELVLNSLYFSRKNPETMPYSEVERIAASGLAMPIPLYVRFKASDAPIVGTSLDYFDFRGLRIARGEQMTRLGDCVLGANVAAARDLGPGSSILSSPETVFDIAGVYPLKMHVTGVLAEADTPDDDAVFVDVKTAWVIQGLGHGHEDLAQPEAAARVLTKRGNVIVGNASVVQYQEITRGNAESFHFHGDTSTFPVSGTIAVPHDRKSGTILRGRYEMPDERRQILEPRSTIGELLGQVVRIKSYVITAFVLVGATTLAVAALVFMLSLRLRRREIETMVKIGGSRLGIAGVVLAEILLVLFLSIAFAMILTALTSAFGSEAVRAFVR